MIKKYSLMALETAINQALSLDDAMPLKLQALNGKSLQIIISPLDVQFFIKFADSRLHLVANIDETPDTIMHTSPLGLIRLSLLPASKVRSLFNDSIRLSGDVELGQAVKKLFDDLDIDWEGHLANFTGDVVAYQIGSVFRRGVAFKQRLSAASQHNITEFLQEELRLFPSREEVDDFFNDVDDTSLHVERLSAQINQLMGTA